jgi:hypothetical protein
MQKFTWLSENQSRQMIEYRRNNPQVFQINKGWFFFLKKKDKG